MAAQSRAAYRDPGCRAAPTWHPPDKRHAPRLQSGSGLRPGEPRGIGRVLRGRFAARTVSAALVPMRRTVELDVRMCTGALAPNKNGPTATLPPAAVLSR